MVRTSRSFQIFCKPTGAICNLACSYCYYLEKKQIYPKGEDFSMPAEILESYINQHMQASPDDIIRFSWHGGEPTILGLDFFRHIIAIEHKYNHRKKKDYQWDTNQWYTSDERMLPIS